MKSDRLREIEYAYHCRVFGEEWARINFLDPESRVKEIAQIVNASADSSANPHD